MQDIMHLNLFGKITQVGTRFCFDYNDTIVFCVPKQLIHKAVGENGNNVKKISGILRRKVKIIPQPKGIYHLRDFIQAIVSPITFKELEIKDDEIVMTAGGQSKAALIGRNKRRLLEMQKIIKSFFGKEFRII